MEIAATNIETANKFRQTRFAHYCFGKVFTQKQNDYLLLILLFVVNFDKCIFRNFRKFVMRLFTVSV